MTTPEYRAVEQPIQPALADDLLFGAAAIGRELGLSERKVRYLVEKGYLPVRRMALS
jgi:hypothetical protein